MLFSVRARPWSAEDSEADSDTSTRTLAQLASGGFTAARVGVVLLASVGLLAACTSSKNSASGNGSSVSTSSAPSSVTSSVSASVTTGATSSATTSKPASTAKSSTSTSAQAPATSSQPAGDINHTVSSSPVPTKKAVPISATATVDGKVTATIVKTAKVTAEGHGVGEFSGPAYAVTLQISNGSAKAVDLTNVVVNLADKAGNPLSPITGSPASPVTGALASGAKASGVYVFALNQQFINPMTISLSFTASTPIVLFVGDIK
jgi:hypothetical protein